MALLKKFPKSWIDENAENITIILNACQKIFDRLSDELYNAKNGLNVNSAEGSYLEQQGQDFNIPRVSGEDDSAYRIRIMEEMMKQRNTINAILTALHTIDELDYSSVYEPWRDLFIVGESMSSDDDRIIDYEYWGFHIIDVLTRLRSDVVELALEKMIAAGKILYVTHIVDILCKGSTQTNYQYVEIDIDLKNITSEQLLILSNETLFDIQGIALRYCTMDSPTIPIMNSYDFGIDMLELPYLQVGFRIKNEIQGVDY